REIAKRHKSWIRIESRYKGSRCPVKRLLELDNLLRMNPFSRVQLRPFLAADPGRFNGIRFVLAHGINHITNLRIPQERVRALFGRNFPRFVATYADLFEPSSGPDLHVLYKESIRDWLER